MPVTWYISDDLVILESDAGATFEEWRATAEAFLASPRYRRGMGILHYWSAAPKTADIRARADWAIENAARFGRTRWALVGPGDASFGMGRMAEAFVEGSKVERFEIRAFRDAKEAESWARGAASTPSDDA
jgi:hypothetical protein